MEGRSIPPKRPSPRTKGLKHQLESRDHEHFLSPPNLELPDILFPNANVLMPNGKDWEEIFIGDHEDSQKQHKPF